jgi:Rieske Fe-S protein
VAAPYRSYVVAMTLKSGRYPDAYFWENNGTHKAITTHSTGPGPELNMLMIAGNHHKTGQATGQEYQHYFDELETWARQHFDVDEVHYRWSAQHYHSGDLVPYIGLSHKSRKRTFIATGFYADGLIYGTVAGLMLGKLMQGQEHPWLRAFDASRSTNLSTAGTFIKENLNVAAQYLQDTPPSLGTAHLEDIKPDEGKVVEVQGEKLAVYRDKQNRLHICSAVCTHMKCIVNFNNAERTWDCPCHGSRFMTDGSVIEGPAIANLARKQLNAEGKLMDAGKNSQPGITNPFT